MSRSRGPDDGCSIRIRFFFKFGSFGTVRRTSEVRSTRAPYVRSGEMGSLRGSAAARTLLQADKNEPPTVVGVNINIPIPVISDLLGSETPHKDRYVRVFSHRTDRSAPHPIPSPYTLTLHPHPPVFRLGWPQLVVLDHHRDHRVLLHRCRLVHRSWLAAVSARIPA